MTTHDGSKGDKRIQPTDPEQFEKNWDAIFNQDDQSKVQISLEADNDHATILATIPFGE
jgi:hypothetical protein